MVEEESKPHIIIDNGGGSIKAGFTGDNEPKVVFQTMIGYPKNQVDNTGDKKEYYIGKNAEEKKEELKLNYPIEYGIVKNWDEMEQIWGHIFSNELCASPEEHNVMLTEVPQNPKFNREKMIQIMFETFNVPKFYIANPANLSIYAVGKFTGFVVDLGDGISQFAPIYEGYSIANNIIIQRLGGRDLTEYMVKQLQNQGYSFYTTSSKEIAKDIKEKACYAALYYEDEIKYIEPFDYELPDGKHLIIKEPRIICPEILFKPEIIGIEINIYNIGETCNNLIQKCDIDKRKDFYHSIILSGGTSMINGLPERFTREIKALAPYSMKEEVKVIASPERKYAAWIGGSILSSISTFESMWITKDEYEEYGIDIVHKKCP